MLQAVEESLLLCCAFNIFYSFLQPTEETCTVEEFLENLLFYLAVKVYSSSLPDYLFSTLTQRNFSKKRSMQVFEDSANFYKAINDNHIQNIFLS